MRFLTKHEVYAKIGAKRHFVDNAEARGEFPKRVIISGPPECPRKVGWIESEVEEWQQARADAREAEAKIEPVAPPGTTKYHAANRAK